MRPGAPPRTSGLADHLSCLDELADACEWAREVRIERRQAAAEVQDDDVPIAVVAGNRSDCDDAARSRGPHGQVAQRADVDPRMEAAVPRAERRRENPVRRPLEA